MQCPKCKKIWETDSEQAVCVELHEACIACKSHSLTRAELDSVLRERKRRLQEYESRGVK